MKTKISQNDIQEEWFLVNVEGARIGTAASRIAELLLGKTDPKVMPNLDPRKHVVVINSGRIDFTAKRGFAKFYKSYSGFPSGLKFKSLEEKFEEDKTFPIMNAVKGMLPKNTRGRNAFSKLHVFEGVDHDHEAQKPVKVDITKVTI